MIGVEFIDDLVAQGKPVKPVCEGCGAEEVRESILWVEKDLSLTWKTLCWCCRIVGRDGGVEVTGHYDNDPMQRSLEIFGADAREQVARYQEWKDNGYRPRQ